MESTDRPQGPDAPVEGGSPPAGEGGPEASAVPTEAGGPPEVPSLETATEDVQALLRRLETLEGEVGDVRSGHDELASEVRTGHASRLDALGLSLGDTNTRLSGVQERVTQLESADRPDPIDAAPAAEAPAPAEPAPPLDGSLGPVVRLGDVASGSLVQADGVQYVVVGPVAGEGEDPQIKVRRGAAPSYLSPDTGVQVVEEPAPVGEPA